MSRLNSRTLTARERARTMLAALTAVGLLSVAGVSQAFPSSGPAVASSGEIVADVYPIKVGPEAMLAQPPASFSTLPATWTGTGGGGGSPVSGAAGPAIRPAGFVERVFVTPGQLVEAGEPVVRLDRRMAFKRLRQAEVMKSLASAGIALVDEQADKLDSAEAKLADARNQLDKAGAMVARARETVNAKFSSGARQLDRLLSSMKRQLAIAKRGVAAASAGVAAAQAAYDADPTAENLAKLQQAQAQLAAAKAGVAQLNVALQTLAAKQRSLAALKAKAMGTIDSKAALIPVGLAKLAEGEAKLTEARARVTAVRRMALARRRQAGLQAGAARLVVSRLVIRAPRRGYVTDLGADVGEVVFANAAVATLSVLDPVKLRLQITPAQARLVSLGDVVSVTVDAWPGRVFRGRVIRVADRVDLMPTNVVTREIHASQAVQVTVSIPNPDLLLKPGIPADAAIQVSP